MRVVKACGEVDLLCSNVLSAFGGKVDLYVADGAVDVGEKYDMQELQCDPLLLGELIVCVRCLKTGGCALVKIVTTFLPFTRSLLAFVVLCFDEVSVVKPSSSKSTNSESYLLCKCFRGCTRQSVDRLTLKLEYHMQSC